MNVIDPGHTYQVNSYDGAAPQTIVFMKREGPGYPGNVGSYGGTNIQEVLRVLIDRSDYLNHQIPCAETDAAIGLLEAVLLLFELRTARRHGRFLTSRSATAVAYAPTCPKCGHVGCEFVAAGESITCSSEITNDSGD